MIRLISRATAQGLEKGNRTIRSWSQAVEQSSVSWVKQSQQTCGVVSLAKIKNELPAEHQG